MTATIWNLMPDDSREAVVGEQRVYVLYRAGWHRGMSGWDYGRVAEDGTRSFVGQRGLMLEAKIEAEKLGQS